MFDAVVTTSATAATVTLRGEVDLAAVDQLEQARDEAFCSAINVKIDLRAVEFIDSPGVKFLLETHSIAQRTSRTLRLVKPPDGVMRTLTLSGADRHLPFVDAVDA